MDYVGYRFDGINWICTESGDPKLMALMDDWKVQGLRNHVHDGTDDGGFHYKRLVDLAHQTQNHTWMWQVSGVHGGAIPDPEEFQEAMRVRLGCGGPQLPTVCAACGVVVMDGTGRHASTCCTGEATRGHNRCVATLFHYAKVIDPDAAMEPREVIPSTRLRPADILTAAGCRLSAADWARW